MAPPDRFSLLLEERRKHGTIAVLDGALATELERRGCDLDHVLWSGHAIVTAPGLVAGVHSEYLRAGADIITTASYQTSKRSLQAANRSAPPERTLGRSVALAKEAIGSGPGHNQIVAASVGPYGAFLADGSEYTGSYHDKVTTSELYDFHKETLSLLSRTEPHVIAFETIPAAAEVTAITQLLQECFPDLSAWVSLSCPGGTHLASGDSFEESVEVATACSQVKAIGINCLSPEYVEGFLHRAGRATDKPLMAYPHSGEVFNAANGVWEEAPGGFGDWASDGLLLQRWKDAGAAVLGGCCRTGPRHVARLRKFADSLWKQYPSA